MPTVAGGEVAHLVADHELQRVAVTALAADLGITLKVYGHDEPQVFPLDAVPRIVPADQWSRISAGLEQRARAMGLNSIFVLTTRTMHWFIKRGFQPVDPDWLPDARKKKYNWDRKSQVLVKKFK